MKRNISSMAMIFLSTALTLNLTDQAARYTQESSLFVTPAATSCEDMLDSCDPCTGYMPSGGLGAMVEAEPRGARLISMMPGHAAAKSGLKLGDRITAIDGMSVQGHDTVWMIAHLRGKIGTTVQLDVERGDGIWLRSFSTEVTRESIDSNHSVYSRIRDGELTVKILWLDSTTAEQLSEHLSQAVRGDVTSVVLDLKNVSYGDAGAAADCASLFLPQNTPVGYMVAEGCDGQSVSAPILTSGFAMTDQLTAIQVGSYTARSGELLAKALADNLNVEVRGEKTAGLGTFDGRTIRSRSSDKIASIELRDAHGVAIEGHPLKPSFWSWSSLLTPAPTGLE